jgi:hypothetical protein
VKTPSDHEWVPLPVVSQILPVNFLKKCTTRELERCVLSNVA